MRSIPPGMRSTGQLSNSWASSRSKPRTALLLLLLLPLAEEEEGGCFPLSKVVAKVRLGSLQRHEETTYLWRSLLWSFPSAMESPAMITRTTRRARSSSRPPEPMRPAKKEKSNLTALEEGPSP